MEKQVVLSLVEFEELTKFKKEIEAGHTVKVIDSYYMSGNSYPYYPVTSSVQKYLSTDEAVKEIGASNETLAKAVEELKDANFKLLHDTEHVPDKCNGKTVFDVRNMSLWEFLKWKVKND